ncbi:MAG: CHAP domain-containing protein [Lachnospiraceae bacterium]|nr:MAG: CHAP domain-containing protein [Lachnospiraceae bacterium]
MRSSLKISNRIDMSGKKVVFNTKETANKAPVKRVVNRKFNMNKMAKNALGSIPSRVFVNGSLDQRMGMEFLKMGQGSIPTVTGSLIKTELNKSGEKTMGIKDINYVLYHDTTGVRTVAKAAYKSGNDVSSDIKKAERNGWVKTEMGWMYNESGKPVTGWKQIDGKWYYFEANGVMQTGWKQVSGKWYYLHTDGAMRTDWKQIGGKWYYFHTDGAMRTGWKQIGDKWYYLHEDGHMAKSEKIQGEDGRVYVIDENGVYTAGNIDKLIDIAMSQRYEITGFKENKKIYINENGEYVESDEGDNDTIYGKWYGMNKEPWCGMFVSWCAAQSGMLNSNKSGTLDEGKIPKFSYCLTGKNIYKKAGRYYPVSSNYEPKRGDLFFHLKKIIVDGKEKWVGHTGIIIAYDKGTDIIYSIEGNTDDSVLIRKTNRLNNDGSSYFDGFGSNGGSSFGDIPEGALSRGGRTN